MPWAAHDSSFTRAFEDLVAWQAQRLDKSCICRLLGINWRTVGTLIERLVEERLSPDRLEGMWNARSGEVEHRFRTSGMHPESRERDGRRSGALMMLDKPPPLTGTSARGERQDNFK